MKCGFCGNELENGAQFCPNCGMIISLGEENEAAQESDAVVESVYNVFKSNVDKNVDKEENASVANPTAQELAVDPTEEKVEFVMSLPEFEDFVAEPIKAPEAEEKAEVKEETAEEVTEDAPAEEIVEEVADDADNAVENPAEEAEDIYSYTSEDIKEQEEVQETLDIRVPEMDVIYEGPEKTPDLIEVPKTAPKNDELRQKKQAKENLEKISPDKKDIKKKPVKSKKKGIDGIKIESILGIAVAVVLVLFACVYAVKNDKIPVLGQLFDKETTTTAATVVDDDTTEDTTVEDETTQDASSQEDTTEDTTEEASTEEITTEESTTKETTTKVTTKPTTTKPTTTKPAATTKPAVTTRPATTRPATTRPATTRPATTRPATTRPAATTRPITTRPAATTRPTTTKPATTKPATTTDKYGINDVTVKKPASYLAKSYTGYVTAEGVNLRSKPSSSSDRVLYLSKGADIVVLAKENGFLYIKSNRYGVYGWVSSSYVSTTRPQSESVVQSGTVTPDKKYETAEIKYTTNGLNIRKGPSTSYAVVGLVPISYPVKVIGYKSGVSGWVYVQDTTYGYTGWVSTAYLK